MLKFFQKGKLKIKSVVLPEMGWTLDRDEKGIKQWIDPGQTMLLSINYFNTTPDIPTEKNLEKMRAYYRGQITEANGGLVEMNFIKLKGVNAIKTIFKIPQNPDGTTYLGALTIPFKNNSYVIKLQASEIGTTGMRDTIIANRLLESGEISTGENGFENWSEDPYLPQFKRGALMNKSEQEIYDKQFSNHPLSQTRKIMYQLENEIIFKPEINESISFFK